MTDRLTFPPGNPFPGMDPWTELEWPGQRLMMAVYSADPLQPRLPNDLVACTDRRVDIAEAGDFVNWAGGPLAPLAPRPRDEKTEPRVTIRGGPDWEEVVTVIEFLGPEDKAGAGRDRYLRSRIGWRAVGVNLLEIDLTRGGRRPMTDAPPHVDEPAYAVTIWRACQLSRAEFRGLDLRSPLPALRVPLRPGEEDLSLELQPVADRAHLSGAVHKLDHARPLAPPLSDDDAAWARELIAAARDRRPDRRRSRPLPRRRGGADRRSRHAGSGPPRVGRTVERTGAG